jgi:putative RecB family exonuclease
MQLEVAEGVLGAPTGGASSTPTRAVAPPADGRSRALSPSRAADFMQCPLLYRFRVVDQRPEPVSAAAARGTLVHAVLERLFDLPAAERTVGAAVALVPGEWERLLQAEPGWAELVRDAATDEAGALVLDAAALAREAAGLVQDWFEVEDPTRLEPEETELYVEADLGGLVIRGVIDRLDAAPDGRLRVVDYKTGRAPSESFEGRALFQLKFYALALWRTRGVLPSRLQLVYPRDRTALWIDPTEAELLATERKVLALWAAIEQAATNGDWRPRAGRACRWCAHQALCPTFGGTPPPLPEDAAVRALDPRAAGQVQSTEDGPG